MNTKLKKKRFTTAVNMIKNYSGKILSTSACFIFLTIPSAKAQDGEAIFKQTCAACHKVGGGRLVGPDLIGVTEKRSEEWLLKWTKSSQSLIKSGDADAVAIFEEFGKIAMPDQSLPDGDIKAIYAFIKSKSTPVQASAEAPVVQAPAAPDASNNASPEMIAQGKNYFTGVNALSNGGAACISCHNVNFTDVMPGGMLAKDLTTVFSRLGGDAGLQGILGAPPFPAMTEAYKNNPLTEQEIASLIAFFNKVDKDKPNQIAADGNILLYGGFGGMGILLLLIMIIWNQKKKHNVKKNIYDRQLKSI